MTAMVAPLAILMPQLVIWQPEPLFQCHMWHMQHDKFGMGRGD